MPFVPIKVNVGEKYGRLIVQARVGSKKGHIMYECLCECGKNIVCRGSAIVSGNTSSCGCLNKERKRKMLPIYRTKHNNAIGSKRSPELEAYSKMMARCYRITNQRYKNYGARGISVCDRWRQGFANFLSDMGGRPSSKHSLERKDVNRNYEPNNCIWATSDIQAANKTTTVRIIVSGKEIHQAALARKIGVCDGSIRNLLKKGKTGDEIIEYFNKRNASKSNRVN